MMFNTTFRKLIKGAVLLPAAMAMLAVSSVDAQTTTVINDSFANGFSDLSADDTELDFFTTSSSAALDSDRTVAGPIDFASGSSGRAIHGLFAPQTLAAVGDSLEVTIDFTTPATIGTNSEDFRFALFSTDRAPGGQADFEMNIAASSSAPNTLLNTIAGVVGEIDNINNGLSSDLGFRTHNVNTVTPTSAAAAPTGRLMTTTTGFDFISGGDDGLITLAPNTDYTARLFIEVTDASLATLEVTVEIFDAAGTSVDSHTDTLFVDDQFDAAANEFTEIGVNTLSFDMLGISVTSSAFGSSNALGDPDNGIDISNVTVTSVLAGSVACLLGDVDLSGTVDFADIAPFISVLSASTFQCEADCDESGAVDFADIGPFITILSGP